MPWNPAEANKTPLAVEGLWDIEKPSAGHWVPGVRL